MLGHHLPGDRYVTRRKDHGLDWGAELWSANFARPRAATAVERSLSRSVGASALPCRAMPWTTPLSASSRASRHDDGVWAGGHALSARRLEKAARLPERISAARVFRRHQVPGGVGRLIGLPRGLWQEAHHVGAAGRSRSGLRHGRGCGTVARARLATVGLDCCCDCQWCWWCCCWCWC